jgi:methyl-accepting chemotaxis protein
MNGFKNLKMTAKLALSFGVLLVIVGAIGAIAIWRLNAVAASSREIARNWLPSVELLDAMNTAKSDLRVEQLRLATATTGEEVARFAKSAQDTIAFLEEKRRVYVPLIADEVERGLWNDFDRKWQAYIEFSNRLASIAQQGKHQDALQMMVDSRADYLALGDALKKDVDRNVGGAADEAKNADQIYSTSRWVIIGMLLVAIVVGGIVAFLSGRAVSRPLNGIIDIFKRIAGGKLDNAIEVDRKDEIGAVLTSLDDMQRQMRKLLAESQGQLTAINRVQAVIEFDLSGMVITANDNFLSTVGYRLEEIKGQHHSMFVDPAYRSSDDYRRFWEKLGRGDYDSGQYKRLGKGAKEVWLQASYNPIFNADGKPYKVIKFATDVTGQVHATRQMEAAVAQTQEVVRSAIQGDLAKRLETHGKTGDLQKMAEAINSLLQSVGEIVSSVKNAADEVMRGAEEISQGNANLSQRTEEQSSSLEETASSMEEMTSTVKQNADNAGQANQLAIAARDQAEKGGAVVGNAVKAMGEINDASKKISDIIGVIDEIAFQTNLLALNAAVEAARAGEQGRGFAVVATEVRSLAGRSATAAKEIKDLIQDSVRKVEDGSALVTESGQTLEQIVMSVKKVSDIVAEIAAASREQSTGIEQVNSAVMQMDEMTQQNAALVEQATAASQSMADQARELTRTMGRYRVDDSGATGVSAGRVSEGTPAPRTERRGPNRPFALKSRVAARSAPGARSGTGSGGASSAGGASAGGARDVAAAAAGGARAGTASGMAQTQSSKTAATGTDADWTEF